MTNKTRLAKLLAGKDQHLAAGRDWLSQQLNTTDDRLHAINDLILVLKRGDADSLRGLNDVALRTVCRCAMVGIEAMLESICEGSQ